MKVKLDDRVVRSLKAAKGTRREVFDTDPKSDGLMLQVAASGVKTWVVRYRNPGGRQRRFVLGRYPTLSLADARSRARDVRGRARDGEDPAGDKLRAWAEARAQPLQTMADLQMAYFLACENGEWKPRGKKKRASTLAEERGLWARHLNGPLGELAIDDVTDLTVKKPLRALVARGRETTANRARALVRQVFNFAIHERRVQRNPVTNVAALGTEKPRERVLADAELRALWAAFEDPSALRLPSREDSPAGERIYVGAPVRIALRLLLLTLARRGEVAGMRRDELDLDQGVWSIAGARTKNGRPLLVPLSTDAIELVKDAIKIADAGLGEDEKPSLFVFPSPRSALKPITPASLSHAVRDLRACLSLGDIRPHDFRRTGASIMVSERLGVTPFIVGRILNHTTETGGAAMVTLRHYALHDFMREKRVALQSWSDLLSGIVGDCPGISNVSHIREAAA